MNYNKIYSKWFWVPAFAIFFILFLLPSILGVFFSFTNWNSMSESLKWVGLENYKKIFESGSSIRPFANTIFFAVMTSVLKGGFGLLLALALNRRVYGRNALRTLFFLPMVLSNVIVGLVFQQIYHPTTGVLNQFLNLLGMGSLAHGWIIEPGLVMWSCVAVEVWKASGFNMVIFLAGLQSVPTDLYEACDMDGGSAWQKFIKVTLPFIMPSVVINMLLNVISGLKVFDVIYTLTNGGPGKMSEVVEIVILNEFAIGNYGYGTAYSTLMFVVLIIISVSVIKRYAAIGGDSV
ncbi:carbohydrate ABC transporter permease [Massiliimalia massiliensis]|uniref:carbohydrate ABC transporter permease n=1 Tax=Massiliimalia massiliensis TaxID=1852384 RepID=UPI000986A6A1|nr:sugar ABC transporter permease [Massiliimalia massiliensis]